jgi:Icc-related predicted phosphoesterase
VFLKEAIVRCPDEFRLYESPASKFVRPCAELNFRAQYGWSSLLKILAVSDEVVERFYSAQIAELFRDIDMIVGCGDLPYEYLEFLVSVLNVPLLYVPGNHDPQYDERKRDSRADGCDLLDRRVRRVKGLNLAGLGGSIRYKPLPPNQYTQAQMYLRMLSLLPRLFRQRAQSGSGLDIMIAHSPPRGIHDDTDPAHTGFSAFRDFIRVYKPRYFLHGHTLVYKSNLSSPVTQVGATTVINVYPYRLLEVDAYVR